MNSNFFAVLSRMKYIRRWGLMRSTREENLSEHSLDTAFIAHALAIIGNRRLNKNYNPERAVVAAMYHDATEILTGDLPTPVKYYNADIKHAYKDIEKAAADRLMSMIPEDLREDYSAAMNPLDDDTLILVKAADKISAYIKCMEEISIGNTEFTQAAESTREAISRLALPEADIFMEEFIGSFGLSLDQQTML